MKIESGRYYKTRDGRKALVVGEMDRALGDGGDFAVQVGGDVHRYKSDGRWQYSTTSDVLDLVAEWQEPVSRTLWFGLKQEVGGTAIDSSFNYESREQLIRACEGSDNWKLIALKHITITEGEGI